MFVEAHIARCQDGLSNGLPCSCGIEYFARPGGLVGIDETEYLVISIKQEQNGDVSWFACHKSGKNETVRDGIVSATTDPPTTMRAAWSAAIKFLSDEDASYEG
jgi:hypothetical protein